MSEATAVILLGSAPPVFSFGVLWARPILVAKGKWKKTRENSSDASESPHLDVRCVIPTHIWLAKACHLAKSMEAALYNPFIGKRRRSEKWRTLIQFTISVLLVTNICFSRNLKYSPPKGRHPNKSHPTVTEGMDSMTLWWSLLHLLRHYCLEKPLLLGLDCLGGIEWAVSASMGQPGERHFSRRRARRPARPDIARDNVNNNNN